MKVLIHVNNSLHQKEHCAAMLSGFRKHGIEATCVPRGTLQSCDVCVLWGFKPPHFIQAMKATGARLLIMERGYFPDRFAYSSLGWDGLNNRAMFPECADGGERFRTHWPTLLKPWKDGGDYVLVCGQVPGDASVYGVDLDKWARGVVQQLLPTKQGIVFRPHPLVRRQGKVNCPDGARLSTAETLAQDLARAAACVTYNSNSGVEAVCAGVPTVTMDMGAMAWPVASLSIMDPLKTPDRSKWAHRLAWCQWRLEEIADGTAWEALKTAVEVAC